MTHVDAAIRDIQAAAEKDGLPALSKRSGVPYTTLVDWQRAGWRPKAVATLEKLALAARASPANDDALPHSEAA